MKLFELAKSLGKDSVELIKLLNENGESLNPRAYSIDLDANQIEFVKNQIQMKHLKIKEIKIVGFWQRKNIKIQLSSVDGRITLLHGVNGIGKTTILEILKEIYGKDSTEKFQRLIQTEFKQIEIVYLDTKDRLKIKKKQSHITLEFGDYSDEWNYIEAARESGVTDYKEWLLGDSERRGHQQRIRGIRRGEATSEYYKNLEYIDPESLDEKEEFYSPFKQGWVLEHSKKVNLFWLDTRRLDLEGIAHVFKYQRIDKHKGLKKQSINHLSNELKFRIKKAQDDYNDKQSIGLEQLPNKISKKFEDRYKEIKDKEGKTTLQVTTKSSEQSGNAVQDFIKHLETYFHNMEAHFGVHKKGKSKNKKDIEKDIEKRMLGGLLSIILSATDLLPLYFGLENVETDFAEYIKKLNTLCEKGILPAESLQKLESPKKYPGIKGYALVVQSELSKIFDKSQESPWILYEKITRFESFANKCFSGKKIWVGDFGIKVELLSKNSQQSAWTQEDARRDKVPKNKNPDLKLKDLSSGEQHLLVLFFVITFLTENSLIIIDEPEISLHTLWQENFMEHLQEACQTSNSEAVIATHSPDIAACVDSRNCIDIYQE